MRLIFENKFENNIEKEKKGKRKWNTWSKLCSKLSASLSPRGKTGAMQHASAIQSFPTVPLRV